MTIVHPRRLLPVSASQGFSAFPPTVSIERRPLQLRSGMAPVADSGQRPTREPGDVHEAHVDSGANWLIFRSIIDANAPVIRHNRLLASVGVTKSEQDRRCRVG
jgi:hypothetical protein